MSLFDKLNQFIIEAPVGSDDTILPNKKDSDKDKIITKKNIKKYPIKEPKTPSQPEVGYGGKGSGFKLTAGVKQSEVSKDAKEFTKDVNKANVKRQETVAKRKYHRGRKAQRAVYKDGLTKDQRVTNIKRDIEVKDAIKIAGGSGDVSPTAPKRIRDRVAKIRSDRAIKAGTPDPFLPKKEYTALKKKFTPKGEKDVIKNLDKKVTTSLDKPVIPSKTVKKVPEKKTLKKAISDIRASDKRLYDAGVGKKPSLVQQRKAGKEAIKAFNLKKQREIRAYQTDYMGGDYGMGQPEGGSYSRAAGKVVNKVPRTKRLSPVGGVLGTGSKKFATFTPQKGSKTSSLVKVDKKPVSGTYSISGGERTITDRKKRVEKIIGDSKKRKDTTLDQDKLNQAQTGKDAKGNILDKETRKKLFQQSRGKTSGGGSGGGKKPPLIGTGGTGGFGGGGKKPRFTKAAFKSKALKFGGKLKNFAKANPLATALAVGAGVYYGYKGIKRAIDGPQLDPRKDFTKTGKIQFGTGSTKDDRDNKKVGDPVRFTYGRKETKNRAKPFLTPDTKKDGVVTKGSISKFRDKVYTVKDKSGKTIDVNKRIQNSAFTKQLRDASTSKKQSAQDFIKKYKKAAEYRGITT